MSFNIALSGIQAINEQLEAVSNNIANSSTYGFKSSRANFSAMYAGEQANGVSVGSLTQNIGTNGSVESTGRSLDAAIEGRGFFVTRDSQGSMSYSRVGIFAADNAGNLVDAAGRKVQGYGPTVNGTLGTMGDIKILTGVDGQQHRISLPTHGAGSLPFTIDPVALGLAPGNYSISAEASDGTKPAVEVTGRLDSVRMSAAGGILLQVAGIGEVDPSSVTGFNGKGKSLAATDI